MEIVRFFHFFEQARQANRIGAEEPALAALVSCQASLWQAMEGMGERLRIALSSVRADLVFRLTQPPIQRLAETSFLSFFRKGAEEAEDAQLYLLWSEEGIEVGFGFGVRTRRKQAGDAERRFFARLQRQHRKSRQYLSALLRHDYRLWGGAGESFQTPSMRIEDWFLRGGVIVRLLERESLQRQPDLVLGVLAQLLGELMGWFGFLERAALELPYIRPVALSAFAEGEDTLQEDDLYQQRDILRHLAVDFAQYAASEGYLVSVEVAQTFILSLQTRPFVILCGATGAGKSRLAQLFSRFVTEDRLLPQGDPHCLLLPVRPDWFDAQGLLGFHDTLAGSYRATPFLQLMLRAQADPEHPYFVILDEMNLARVEYYLADLLSLLESRVYDAQGQLREQAPLALHNAPLPYAIDDPYIGASEVPPLLRIPTNLYLIGTLNLDETTHRLSPKILDRAHLIELLPPTPSLLVEGFFLRAHASLPRSTKDIASVRSAFTREASFTAMLPASSWLLPPALIVQMATWLDEIFALFERAGIGLGLRAIKDLLSFAENAYRMFGQDGFSLRWVSERFLLQKLLPRLHGTPQQIGEILQRLLFLALDGWEDAARRQAALHLPLSSERLPAAILQALEAPKHDAPAFPHAARKIALMLQRLERDGYTDIHF